MLKFLIILILSFFTHSVSSNDNLLTIQQQLDRLQREVSDLSQTVFANQDNTSINSNNNDLVTNLSAIDMRIYDLEKDVKNLTANFEEIFFQIEDLIMEINNFNEALSNLEKNLFEFKKTDQSLNSEVSGIQNENIDTDKNDKDDNTLGTLKITSSSSENTNSETENNQINNTEEVKLSPEAQFQSAFDNIRGKNWEDAKNSFINFLKNNPENQLSGSAHYWLGELYILEEKYRDAALVLAEGYQKFPTSIKAPDMLFKLAESLYEVNKVNDSCNTLEKLVLDFPKNKIIKNANKNLQKYGCLDDIE